MSSVGNKNIIDRKSVSLNKEQKAYLAGIIDGEGCLFIRPRKYRHGITYVPGLSIANTNKKLLYTLKSWVGTGCIVERPGKESYHKPVYAYVLSSLQLGQLLPQLKLIVKEKQRLILIKVIKILSKRKFGFGNYDYQYGIKKLTMYHQQMKELNKRGK